MPRVSVCISVYNGADTLGDTLQSAQAQNYRDYEILVLDDGSTDSSADIAEEVGCRVVRQENRGRGFALRRMMELAQGELIALLDADDRWEEDKLQKQVPFLDQTGADLVHSGGWFHYPEGKVEPRVLDISPDALAWDHILPHNRIIACSALFKREAILRAGNFDERAWAACDWQGWLAMAAESRFAYQADQLVHYIIRPGSIANRGYRFQSGKRFVLKELILPQADRLFADLPPAKVSAYRKMILEDIGIAASTMARTLDEEGKKAEAEPLHKEALQLAGKVPRVWTRYLKHKLKR